MSIPERSGALAERLRDVGYSTAAVSASAVVRKSPGRFNRWGGYGPGFDRFDESCEEADAGCVNARVDETLESLGEPFFLYVHYLDPHNPYRPPADASRRFSARSSREAATWARTGDGWLVQQWVDGAHQDLDVRETDVRHLSDLYDDEVAYVDRRIGELIHALEANDGLDRTLVVIASDHGEELMDNESWGHCGNLAFQSVLGVPLIFAVPGFAPGWRQTPVSNLDIVPTILDLVGVPARPSELEGQNLAALLRRAESEPARRLAFAAQGGTRAVRDLWRSLRINLRGGSASFEELSRQRGFGPPDEPSEADLREALRRWMARVESDSGGVSLDPADGVEAELRALGYL